METFNFESRDIKSLPVEARPEARQRIINGIFEAIENEKLISIRGKYITLWGSDIEIMCLSGVDFMDRSEYYGYGGYKHQGGWTYEPPLFWK